MAETPLTPRFHHKQGQGAETEMLGGKAKSSLSKQRQVWPVGATSIHPLDKQIAGGSWRWVGGGPW